MFSKIEQEMIISHLGLEGIEENSNKYNFRCHICGDSKKNKYKKRGYLFWYEKYQTYMYKCQNCGVSYPFRTYLKLYHPDIYKQQMIISIKNNPNKLKKQKKKNENKIQHKIQNSIVRDTVNKMTDDGIIIPLIDLNNSKINNALYYLYDRQIPSKKLKNFYYSENFYKDVYNPLKLLIGDIKQEDVKDNITEDPRIFWFIRNRVNDIIGIQARSLISDNDIRYLTVKIEDDVMIGNIENIDLNKRIYITEGYIDSLFLPNSLSLNGSSFKSTKNRLEKLNAKEIIFVFDNEPYNKEIRKKVEEAIYESICSNEVKIGICLLPKDLRSKGKDINDYIKKKISKKEILNIIDKNTFYGQKAKIKFIWWK